MVSNERAAGGRAAVRGVHDDSHRKFHGRSHHRLSLHASVDAASHTFPRRQVFTVQAWLVFLADFFDRFVFMNVKKYLRP